LIERINKDLNYIILVFVARCE